MPHSRDGARASKPGSNVHRRGTDTRQGALLVAAGTRLRAPEIAIAASAGMARIRVSSQPMLVVISTGNELIEPGEPVLPHQMRRSNAYAIVARCGARLPARRGRPYRRRRAEPARAAEAFTWRRTTCWSSPAACPWADSTWCRRSLEELGVRAVFHKVAQRPGKPMLVRRRAFGSCGLRAAGQSGLHAGLPGALCPAGAVAGHRAERGARVERMALGAALSIKPPLTHFMPGAHRAG